MVEIYEPEAFDPFFYCTYHADLKGLSARQARSHYRRFGRREVRHPNPAAMLKALQAREQPLPADFSGPEYLRLNGDLQQMFVHSWQAAEHYLKHGRREGRRFKPSHIRYVDRSGADQLRRRLVHAFGEQLVDEALVQRVHQAASSAAGSATPAAFLMDPLLLGRWLLISSEFAGADFASLRVQLRVLFRVAFDPFFVASPSAVEAQVLNRLRTLAITTDVIEAELGRPALTLLILARHAASAESFADTPTAEQARLLVARFFARDVRRMGLERFVTAEQRAQLREPITRDDATPLAMVLLAEVAGDVEVTPAGCFIDQDAWLNDMDYVLSSEQLEAAQVQVKTGAGEVELLAPAFLLRGHQAIAGEGDWAARELSQAWLERFVWREREDRGLPQTIVGASASAHVTGAASRPKAPVQSGLDGHEGRKLLRVGDLVSFGADGAGGRHLVGRGWHGLEAAHVWSASNTALLAINLKQEDLGPLDLFLRLSLGPRHDREVAVWWNGSLVGTLRPWRSMVSTLNCHLGVRHRSGTTPNILCLGVDDMFQIEGDGRRLGLALHDLILVRR